MNVGIVGYAMFAGVTLLTLLITAVASKRLTSTSEFYSAGGSISGPLNGLAISGDFLSATTLLGITGLFFATGFDAVIYLICPLVGMMIMLSVLAGPIKRMGQFTLADILTSRFAERPMRILSATNTLIISVFYLVAQMVGAGALIEIIFGIPYLFAVIIVGVLMSLYVALGGMLATTWVQIVKACLLVLGIALICMFSLAHFQFDYGLLSKQAAELRSGAFFGPGALTSDLFSSLSLSVALVFGMCGLPHILIRFFTVPDERSARLSVAVAMSVIAFAFIAILLVVGPVTVALLTGNASVLDETGAIIGGGNMAILHMVQIIGGPYLVGFIAAVVFATILAVVAGLTLASVGALSHDLLGLTKAGQDRTVQQELNASRLSGLIVGAIAIALGVLFEGQNLAYLIGLVFAVAASANFPILLLALYDSRATTRSVLSVGLAGLITSVCLVIMGPAVWVDILGADQALVSLRYPALVSMAVSFVIWLMTRPAAK